MVTDEHIRVPSAEPAANVRFMESKPKSPFPTVAATRKANYLYHQWWTGTKPPC